MNIRYGVRPETFKLTTGNGWTFNHGSIDGFGKSLGLVAGRNDRAAFQLVLAADTDIALHVGESAWFSQKIGTPVIRLQAESPYPAELHIIDMHADDDRLYRADAILNQSVLELPANTPRAVWVEVRIPQEAETGVFPIAVKLIRAERFSDEEIVGEVRADVEVIGWTLPDVRDNRFHLDLWQHNSNIARKHEVKLWSDEHFQVLEGYARSLGELGQKAVTLVVSEAPWSGQSCYIEYRMKANLFEYSIIPVYKRIDGGYDYDFSKAQRYIDLCARYGIDREISLYGLANVWCSGEFPKIAPDYPDGMKIRYYDEAEGLYKYMNSAADIDAYILAIEQYFIRTGQIERVRLAADEPADVEAYRRSIGHIMEIAPAFKLKAALNHSVFIPEFGGEVYDFAPSIGSLCAEFDKITEYKNTLAGKRFLWYVCCGPDFPNTFVRSNLAEAYFIGVLTSYANLDGFLRWNYTVWNDAPRDDIRYGPWPAGDTNFVYPAANGAPLLSLRWKALKRGIELYELLEALKATGDVEALERAYGYVVREKDIRQYYQTAFGEGMCSLAYEDYMAMKRFVLNRLAAEGKRVE